MRHGPDVPATPPGQVSTGLARLAEAYQLIAELTAHIERRVSYEPKTCGQAASLVSGHHIPM